MGGHHHHLRTRICRKDLLQQFPALKSWHNQIKEHDLGADAPKCLSTGSSAVCRENLYVRFGQCILDEFQVLDFVINSQQLGNLQVGHLWETLSIETVGVE
jgi:hypothetical protein